MDLEYDMRKLIFFSSLSLTLPILQKLFLFIYQIPGNQASQDIYYAHS